MKKEQRYVILGNSTAAVAAVEAVRSVDTQGSITLVAEEPYHTYSRPLISYYLSGQVSEEQMLYRPLEFYRENRIETRLGTTAALLDTVKRRVYLSAGQGKKAARNKKVQTEDYIEYDRLLLATGSRPAAPPIPGINLNGVHYFYTLDHIKAIQADLKKGFPVVVLGSGLIGMKAAEALCKLGFQVFVVEMADRVLPTILDREGASVVQSWMEEHGIRFYLNNRAEAISGEKQVNGIRLADGSELLARMVIVATGVRPNVELTAGTPIEVRQGIVVNEYQETSLPGIYCAGDVCEGYDPLYGQHRLTPILPSAYHQGRVAGLNMAGEKTANSGLVAFNSTTFFGMPVATMGLSSAAAGEESFNRSQDREYRSLTFKGDHLVGGVFVNCAQRAGIFQQLIKERAPVKRQKDQLLQSVPRLIDFPGIEW